MSNPLSREARDAIRARWREGRGWVPGKHYNAQAEEDVRALLDALDAAEALVSTLGSAVRRVLDDDLRPSDGPDVWRDLRAALASYQEWDRANPSTGEGTE